MPRIHRLSKLSRRIAKFRTLRMLAGGAFVALAAGCTDASPLGPSPSEELPIDGLASILPATTGIGDRVKVTHTAYVRSAPRLSASLVGTQPVGALGTVKTGPAVDVSGDGLTRYQVDFDTGADGYVAAPYLDRISTAPVVASVVISPKTASLTIGGTKQFTVVARDGTGTIVQGVTTTWRSKDTTRVRVSVAGLVTAIAVGTVWVVVSSGPVADSAAVSVTIPTAAPAVRVGKYVSPSGLSTNDGTVTRPWPLATALSGASGRVVAGDTIWVRGGTYRGTFTSSVAGVAGRTVVVRAYPGERAILEHQGTGLTTLNVKGAYSVFWGLEIMNPSTIRTTSSTASEQRANGVANDASNTAYINMIIHDTGVAFYNYPARSQVEISGSIIYNNGWQGPDRGHGHALYVKSDLGPITIRDNVIFNQFGYGVHLYSNAGSGRLNNIRIEGNTAFNNGTLSTNSNSENILVGGEDVSTGSAVVNNVTYFSPGRGGRNVRVGYGTTQNGTVTVTGNKFIGGTPVLDYGFWSSSAVSNNTLVGAAQMVRFNNTTGAGTSWSGNTQRRDPAASAWSRGSSWQSFSAWRTATGLGGSDQALSGTPSGTETIVRANQHEAGRATITVLNWTGSGSPTVALSGVLSVGDRYEVRSVQSLFGPPLASGTFGGSITLPMGVSNAPVPVGMGSSPAPRTGAAFDVFLVTRVP